MVLGIDGVLACEFLEQTYATRKMAFRIVYAVRKIPEGILNRLANTPDLEIRPRD